MEKKIDHLRILRYFKNTCTKEEREHLEAWISADPKHKSEIESLRLLWNGIKKESPRVDIDTAWRKVAMRAGITTQTVPMKTSNYAPVQYNAFFKYAVRAAAVVVVLLGVFYAAYWYGGSTNTPHLAMKEVTTEKGQRVTVKFADGTSVTLNSMSTIKFPEKFSGALREVSLQGEAYFEVTHNQKAPFIVRTDNAVVKVLGTGFNVQAWPDDNNVEVVVVHGKVSVQSGSLSSHNEVILTKGQQSIVGKGTSPTQARDVNLDEFLSWTEGRLEFHQTALQSVLKQLGRRYDVQFDVKDSLLLQKTLTATIKDESLKEVLNLMALSLNLHYEKRDGVVVLK